VVQALDQAGFDEDRVQYGVYAMDTKRRYNTPEQIEAQAAIALEKIEAFGPDVVVTLDDNAFRTVALAVAEKDIPVVFSGLNRRPESYLTSPPWLQSRQAPGGNITGVIEKIHFVTAVKVQKNILPSLRRVLVLSDNSPTGKALTTQIRDELEHEELPVEIDFFITDSWEEYQQAVLDAPKGGSDTLYPVALRLKDAQGTTYTAKEILSWTGQHSELPSIPLNYAFGKLGLFGGAGVDFHGMGLQAGQMVARVLSGQAVGSVPIEDAERYALVFHLKRADALGIAIPDDILLAADEVYRN
jgi:ABC-type uncharacterized transport system substrate-binding protein